MLKVVEEFWKFDPFSAKSAIWLHSQAEIIPAPVRMLEGRRLGAINLAVPVCFDPPLTSPKGITFRERSPQLLCIQFSAFSL